jgi:hypothetical protein
MSEERAEDASAAFTRVREVADYVRAAQERIATLEAGIRAMRESTRRDLQVAQDRVDDAERRCREAESRLAELVSLITQELPTGLSLEPRPASAEVRPFQRPTDRPADRMEGLRNAVDGPDRPRAIGE